MKRPNIIYILADDMGYGDVSFLNENGKIPTPNIDRIAHEGMYFTDAHSTSALCSPSRYGILTGRYNWRKLAKGLVAAYGDTIIPPERKTVANFLGDNGYDTACFGKWHLGMGWNKIYKEDGKNFTVDYTKDVKSGPLTNGFDYYFGVDVPNWPPFCFIENKRVTQIPEKLDPFPFKICNEEATRKGDCVKGWDFKKLLPTFSDKVCKYIDEHSNTEKPFFIYFPLTSPHVPLAVNDEWAGRSGLNLYADFVMETDSVIGNVLEQIDRSDIAQNTIVIFATDNGCAKRIGCDELISKGHSPSYIYRGFKSDAWDGGHRIPLAVRWPEVIKENSCYSGIISLSDFMATVADIINVRLPDTMGEDSISMYPVLKGEDVCPRNVMIQHSQSGKFAVRMNEWKLILCAGSGGFRNDIDGTHPFDNEAEKLGLPRYQLYNLDADPEEKVNLYPAEMEKAKELLAILQDYIDRGRSTPGENQPNDIEVHIDPETEDGEAVLDDVFPG